MDMFGKPTREGNGLFGPVQPLFGPVETQRAPAFGPVTTGEDRPRLSEAEVRAEVLRILEDIPAQPRVSVVQPVLQRDGRTCFIASCLAVARALGANRSGFSEAALVRLAESEDLMTPQGFKTAANFQKVHSFMSTHLGLELSSYGGNPIETAEALATLMNSGKLALVNAPLGPTRESSFHWRALAAKETGGFRVADPLRSGPYTVSSEQLGNWLVGHAFLPASVSTTVYGVEAKK